MFRFLIMLSSVLVLVSVVKSLCPVANYSSQACEAIAPAPEGGGHCGICSVPDDNGCAAHLLRAGRSAAQWPLNALLAQEAGPNTSLHCHGHNPDWVQGFFGFDKLAKLHPELYLTHSHIDSEGTYKRITPMTIRGAHPPDILWWPIGKALEIADDLLDLRPLLAESRLDQVLDPRSLDACRGSDGGVYCISLKGTIWWFMYSKPVFERAGVTKPPDTFDELLDTCRVIRAAGFTPIALGAEDWAVWTLSALWDIVDMRTNGADFHSNLSSGLLPYTDERARNAMLNLQLMKNAGCFNDDFLSVHPWSDSFRERIKNGTFAMTFMADWYRKEFLGTDHDVFPFPTIKKDVVRGEMMPAEGFVIPKSTTQIFPLELLLSEVMLSKTNIEEGMGEIVQISPRLDTMEPQGHFWKKKQEVVNQTSVRWTAFDMVVPTEFWAGFAQYFPKWFSGSLLLDDFLEHCENLRLIHGQRQNPAPRVSPSSGSYSDSATIMLTLPESAPYGAKILYSIDDDEITNQYSEPIVLGVGEYLVRAKIVGGKLASGAKLADSAIVKTRFFITQSTSTTDAYMILLISVCALCGLVFLTFSGFCVRRFLKSYNMALKAQKQQRAAKMDRVNKAVNSVTQAEFPMCLMSFSEFLQENCLRPHEQALARGRLKFLHTYEDIISFAAESIIIFISHQWLASRVPDPNNIHYHAICEAVRLLAQEEGLDLRRVFLWVDYISIPQANISIKLLAINSIGVYAACAAYFLAIVPTTMHADHGAVCDEDSYSKRGWCRLEQWARLAIGGAKNMFIYADFSLKALAEDDERCKSAIKVFSGDFTVDSDKFAIVDIFLGLWGHCLFHYDQDRAECRISERTETSNNWEAKTTVATLHSIVTEFSLRGYITHHNDEVFPMEFFDDLQLVMGQMIKRLQVKVRDRQARIERFDDGICKTGSTDVASESTKILGSISLDMAPFEKTGSMLISNSSTAFSSVATLQTIDKTLGKDSGNLEVADMASTSLRASSKDSGNLEVASMPSTAFSTSCGEFVDFSDTDLSGEITTTSTTNLEEQYRLVLSL